MFMSDEQAAASTEYALLVLLVALAIIGVATTVIGPKVAAIFTKTDTEFPTGLEPSLLLSLFAQMGLIVNLSPRDQTSFQNGARVFPPLHGVQFP